MSDNEEKVEESIEEKIDNAIEVAKDILPSRRPADELQRIAQSILNLSHAKVINDSLGPTEELNKELSHLLGKVRSSIDGTALVQTTQAILHLVNARALLIGKVKPKKPGASAS